MRQSSKHIRYGANVLAWFVVSSAAGTLAIASSDPMACVSALRLPVSGPAAPLDNAGGTVEAAVVVGKGGKGSKVSVRGAHAGLRADVEAQLVFSEFRPACEGRTIRFVFSFQFEGEPSTQRYMPEVTFRPPDRFVIRFHRVAPVID